MIVRLPSSPTAKPPQLHTRKNHDTYNGTDHLPLDTHVRVTSNHTYCITLLFPYNRACEIYRSHDDFVTLSRELQAPLPCLKVDSGDGPSPIHKGVRTETEIEAAGAKKTAENNDREGDMERDCPSCCCCSGSGAELNCFLEAVLKRVKSGNGEGHGGEKRRGKGCGDAGVRVALEW